MFTADSVTPAHLRKSIIAARAAGKAHGKLTAIITPFIETQDKALGEVLAAYAAGVIESNPGLSVRDALASARALVSRIGKGLNVSVTVTVKDDAVGVSYSIRKDAAPVNGAGETGESGAESGEASAAMNDAGESGKGETDANRARAAIAALIAAGYADMMLEMLTAHEARKAA